MKKLFRSKQKKSLALLFCASLFFCACNLFDMFEEKPAEYLARYGYIADITNCSYDGGGIWSDGFLNITSENDFVITYTIENPGNYEPLACEVEFPHSSQFATLTVDPETGEEKWTYSISAQYDFEADPSKATVTLTSAMLAEIDGDVLHNDISPTLKVYRLDLEDPERLVQGVHTLNLKCNSPPPKIEYGIGQMHSDASVKDRFVIALDLPAPLPADVVSLTVNAKGKSYKFTITDGAISDGQTSGGWKISSNPPENLEATYEGGTEFSSQGGTPCYILTDVFDLPKKDPFEIELILTDSGGLFSSFTLFSHERKLSTPISNCDGEQYLPQDEGEDFGTFKIIYPPSNTEKATVHFRIENEDGSVFDSGEFTGEKSFKFYPKEDGSAATYKVTEAYATLADFLQSNDGAANMGISGTVMIEGSQLESLSSNKNEFKLGDEDFAEYILSAQEDGILIKYEIVPAAGEIISGEEKSPAKIKLPPGTYAVSATASKKYHKDSEEFSEDVTVKSFARYVSKDGSDTSGNGTKKNPFKTLAKALASFEASEMTKDAEGNPECSVFFLSDMTIDAEMTGGASATVNLKGCKGGASGSSVTLECGFSGTMFNVSASSEFVVKDISFSGKGKNASAIAASGGKISLENSNISGFKNDFGAVKVEGGIFSLRKNVQITGNKDGAGAKDCNVYLADGQKIKVEDSLSSSKIGITLETSPDQDTDKIVFTEGYSAKNASSEPSAHFTNDLGLSVGWNSAKTEGTIFYVGGGGMITPELPANLSCTLTPDAAGQYLSITVKDNGTPVSAADLTDWKIEVYWGTTMIRTATSNSVRVDDLPQGLSYTISFSFKYKGQLYSDELQYKKPK